jgi:hypothetical protein
MAEAGWHPKREARRFEPPPWERDRFDELERARQEREAETAAGTPVETGADSRVTAPPLDSVARAAEPVRAGPVEAPRGEPQPRKGTAEAREGAPRVVPDAHVDAMLVQLKAEEPGVEAHGRTVSIFSAALMMFMGVCMLAWGGIAGALAKGQIAGAIGALIVFVMGGLFAGTGLWLGLRATRRED